MTSTAPPALPTVTGRVEEKSDEKLVLSVTGTDYRLHLVPAAPIAAEMGDRVTGVVRAQARRVDKVPSGGRFIEPVFGRPRQVQGRVVGGDVQANVLYVHAGVPIHAALMAPQQAGDFAIGQMVNFSVERGATFEPVG